MPKTNKHENLIFVIHFYETNEPHVIGGVFDFHDINIGTSDDWILRSAPYGVL